MSRIQKRAQRKAALYIGMIYSHDKEEIKKARKGLARLGYNKDDVENLVFLAFLMSSRMNFGSDHLLYHHFTESKVTFGSIIQPYGFTCGGMIEGTQRWNFFDGDTFLNIENIKDVMYDEKSRNHSHVIDHLYKEYDVKFSLYGKIKAESKKTGMKQVVNGWMYFGGAVNNSNPWSVNLFLEPTGHSLISGARVAYRVFGKKRFHSVF